MSVVYPVSLINTRLTDVATAIDAGGGNAVLRLLNSLGTILSSLPLARPCGTVANGILSFAGLSWIDPAAVATGMATSARIEDSAGNIVISGLTVGTAGTDVLLSPITITAGDTVAITAATITGH